MKGYPRKTCKKAKAASLSLLCDRGGEEGLAALYEGVGGETCYPGYPATHKLRRPGPGRGLGGDPQVGDARESITILSSSARRALHASLVFGARRSPPSSVIGKHSAQTSELDLLPGSTSPRRRTLDAELKEESRGDPGIDLHRDHPASKEAEEEAGTAKEEPSPSDPEDAAVEERPVAFWSRFRSCVRRGFCCVARPG